MNKYKYIFKKNVIMMLAIVFVLLISIFLINLLASKNMNGTNTIGGSFTLTNQFGEIYQSNIIKKKKLIYFGYTFCPDVCPFDILKLSKFLDARPNLTKDNEFIFITVDPYRDDVEQINNFLENFNSSIMGLTGSQKKVDDVIKNFKIFVKINGDKNDPNYLVDHSALFFLIDENDQYISHFRPNDFKYSIDKYF